MCIIAVKKKGLPVWDDATITEMYHRNPDGAGLMWVEQRKYDKHPWVYIRKGFMDLPSLLDFVHQRTWDDVPLVLHCRIGTSGGNTPLNCHPYPLYEKNFTEGKCHAAMAHNGVLHYYNPVPGEGINDTQIFVREVVNALPHNLLDDKRLMNMIERLSDGSRLCFLREDGKISLTGSGWVKDNGYYYSNSSYKPLSYRPWERTWYYPTGYRKTELPLGCCENSEFDKNAEDSEDFGTYGITSESQLDDFFADWDEQGNTQICFCDDDEQFKAELEDFLCDNFNFDPETQIFSSPKSRWAYMVEDDDCIRTAVKQA